MPANRLISAGPARAAGCLALICALGCLPSAVVLADTAPAAHDPQHDFDFEIGSWTTHVKRLLHPLTGSAEWGEYDGTSVVQKVWDGRANLVQLEVDGPKGHMELASFRLYNPETHEWSLNVASSRSGSLGVPTVGGFKDGQGAFYDKESWGDKPIVVRFVITPRGPDAIHFEQAFSADDGKTWELNWIADDTRVAPSL